jgi:hypothetical protein
MFFLTVFQDYPLVPKFLVQKKIEKKGVYIPMKRSRDSYAAGGTPAVVKEYRAQLAAVFKRRGVSLDVFLETNDGFPCWATNLVPEREGDRRRESSSVS